MFRSICIFVLSILPSCIPLSAIPDEVPIMLDPGHGGAIVTRKDDKWDPVTKQYLDFYLSGMIYQKYTEHELVLSLSKKVKVYLDMTRTAEGWEEFQKILRLFSDQPSFERIVFRTDMSRTDGWQERKLPITDPQVNAPYRMYDFPDASGDMQMGRISYINHQKPYLVLALHLNPAEGGNPGGMGAVLSPGYQTFEMLRRITVGELKPTEFYKSPWAPAWLISDPGFTQFESAKGDAWVYFHGYRMLKNGTPWLGKNRGLRYNMIQWSYRDPPGWEKAAARAGPGQYAIKYNEFRALGRFFDRERGAPETWRREGGPMGYGGDNHYASDELLRFVQMGLPAQVPARRTPGSMGEIVRPFVSTYALPTFTNAICAYLEIGHLNIARDRSLVIEDDDAVAKSLAAGIYSLFRGLKLKKFTGAKPRGAPVNFSKYENLPDGNYFRNVVD